MVARFVPTSGGMNALVRPLAVAGVGAVAGGAFGFGVALVAFRTAGPVIGILVGVPPFALRGWSLAGEIGPKGGRVGAAMRTAGLLAGGLMGLFLGTGAVLAQSHSPYPVAAAPLTVLFGVRGFWRLYEFARNRGYYRFLE
jgi:hypothetical protein